MARVAQHLQLPEGTAPTATQYRNVWKEAAPGWSATRVGEAWGRYEFAQLRSQRSGKAGDAAPRLGQRHSPEQITGGLARSHPAIATLVERKTRAISASLSPSALSSQILSLPSLSAAMR